MAEIVKRETLRKCPKCGKKHARKHSYCGPCHAENMRENYRPKMITIRLNDYKRLRMMAGLEDV